MPPDFSPMMPNPFALPPFERRHQEEKDISDGTDITTPQLAPEQVAAQEAQSALTDEKIAVSADQARLEQERAVLAQQAAAQEAAIAQQKMVDQQVATEKSQGDIDEWTARLRDSRKQFDSQPAPALFADRGTAGNVMLGVGLALGAIGDAQMASAQARLGFSPTAGGGTVKNIIETDLNRQREKIKHYSDKIVMAKSGMADALDARRMLYAQVDQKAAAAYGWAEKLAKARLSSQNLDAPAIEEKLRNLGFKDERQKALAASVSGLTQNIAKHHDEKMAGDTTVSREDPGAGKQPTASLINLPSKQIFNVKGEPFAEASTPEQADQLMRGQNGDSRKSIMGTAEALRGELIKLRDLQKNEGSIADMNPVEMYKKGQLRLSILEKIKSYVKDNEVLGALTNSDVGLVLGHVGGPTTHMAGAGAVPLDNAIKTLDSGLSKKVASYGFKNPEQFIRLYRNELPAPDGGNYLQAPPGYIQADAKASAIPPHVNPSMPERDAPKGAAINGLKRDPIEGGSNGLPAVPGTIPGSAEDVNSEAPLEADLNAPSIDDYQGKITPPKGKAAYVPTEYEKPESRRDLAISVIKSMLARGATMDSQKIKDSMTLFRITEGELK